MDATARLMEMHAVERLAARDATLFSDPALASVRLGWVGMADAAAARADEFTRIAAEAAAAGVSDVVVLGMGGSSLAPLVLVRSIAGVPGFPTLHVVDTVSPAEAAALMDALTPSSTMVIVASKSGTTIEPLALLAVFRSWLADALGDDATGRIIAITDPGSPLETLAVTAGFARIVHAPSDVGGRFAALTPFAMLPAALSGIDVGRLAATAQVIEEACVAPYDKNPAVALAAWMADAYADGRDKLTLVCSPAVEAFGLWVEQLVAESTGKDGGGLLPVLERSPGLPGAHGADRMTFLLRTADDAALAALAETLPSGEPVFEVVIDDPYALAAEFVHWQWAVALLSAVDGVEPFGQPDVERPKAATRAILRDPGTGGTPPAAGAHAALSGSPGIPVSGLADAVAGLVARIGDRGYLAVLAYLPEDERLLAPLRAACDTVAVALHVPVTIELGPRYLHSTGQYHKGGPAGGAFLVVSVTDAQDLPVSGEPFTLAGLHAAQPAGDAAALIELGRPVLRVELAALSDLDELTAAIGHAAEAWTGTM